MNALKHLSALRRKAEPLLYPVADGPYRLSLADELVVHAAPYPHFVKDAFLPWDIYQQMLAHWPAMECFDQKRSDECALIALSSPETVAKLPDAQRAFWMEFVRTQVIAMIRASLLAYGAKAYHKYGADLGEIVLYEVNITEAFKPIRYLNIHAHHTNTPTFIGTCIFYVEDAGMSERGTSIYGLRDGAALTVEDYVDLCAELEYEHRNELECKRKVDFAPNRLLSICDSPITFHGVDDCSFLGARGPRKMLTIQWGASSSWFSKIHGMDLDEHLKLRQPKPPAEGETQPRRKHVLRNRSRDVLRTDLLNFLEEPDYTREELLAQFRHIYVVSHKALAHLHEQVFPD